MSLEAASHHGSGGRGELCVGWCTRSGGAALSRSRGRAGCWALGFGTEEHRLCSLSLSGQCSDTLAVQFELLRWEMPSLCLCAATSLWPGALLPLAPVSSACLVQLTESLNCKTLYKACRKEINSSAVVISSNLHFPPCLKWVLLYQEWSLIFLPSCCLEKPFTAPSPTVYLLPIHGTFLLLSEAESQIKKCLQWSSLSTDHVL